MQPPRLIGALVGAGEREIHTVVEVESGVAIDRSFGLGRGRESNLHPTKATLRVSHDLRLSVSSIYLLLCKRNKNRVSYYMGSIGLVLREELSLPSCCSSIIQRKFESIVSLEGIL